MDVDRPLANRTTARHGNVGFTKTGQQRTQHQNRCAHGLNQLIRGIKILNRTGVDLNIEVLINHQRYAHATEQFHGRGHVMQMGHITDGDRFLRQ